MAEPDLPPLDDDAHGWNDVVNTEAGAIRGERTPTGFHVEIEGQADRSYWRRFRKAAWRCATPSKKLERVLWLVTEKIVSGSVGWLVHHYLTVRHGH